jgi:hypothetical protein
LHPCHLTDQGAEPWPIAGVMLRGQVRLEATAATRAIGLMQDPVGNVYGDGWQCNHLVRVVRGKVKQIGVATATLSGSQMLGGSRTQQGLAGAQMSGLSAGMA